MNYIANIICKKNNLPLLVGHPYQINENGMGRCTWYMDDETSFILYSTGDWDYEKDNQNILIKTGKATPPVNKSWISRIVKTGIIAPMAINEVMEWRELVRKGK